jgi:hypothetical protein
MRKRDPLLPSLEQELLLKAALEAGEPARKAWAAWRGSFDYGALDEGTLRLAPLLHANLKRLGIADPLLARMSEVRRVAWYRQIQLTARLKAVLAAFAPAGIETLLLKGLPLGLAYYDDADLRPIGDLDLMIRHRDWGIAVDLLAATGWRAEESMTDPLLRSTHAIEFKDRTGYGLDLHHSPFHECLEPIKLEPFWARSVPLTTGDFSSRMLCPADQLLHCLTHGLRANEVATVRWVADAVMILRREPGLDWQRLLDQTARLRFGQPMATGLAYLTLTFPGLVPDDMPTRLRQYKASLFEHVESFARRHEHLTGQGSRFGYFFRLHEGKAFQAKLAQVPSYLADTFGTRPGVQTVRTMGHKAWKALKGFL